MLSVKLKEHFEKEGVTVKEKVYCINCKHYQAEDMEVYVFGSVRIKEKCLYQMGVKSTYREIVPTFPDPPKDNVDNDCPYYKEKEK